MASMRYAMKRSSHQVTPKKTQIPKYLNPDLVRKEELYREERAKKYETREWRELKNISDMGTESQQSVIDSENGDDYLIKGLNWHNKGDISHLNKTDQKIVKKQREKARVQGGLKYIGVLKGQKMHVEVNAPMWRKNERRRRICPVEFYETHKSTRKVIECHQLEEFNKLISADEEEDLKMAAMMMVFKENQEEDMKNAARLKFTAEQLKNMRDNAGLMGERKIGKAAEQQFFINEWAHHDNMIDAVGGKITRELYKKMYGDMNEQEMQGKEEMNKFMMLHNYIDKYQEKLGLTGIAKKKTQTDKVLAFINKCTGRSAQDIVIDFASFKKAKTALLEKGTVRSTLLDACISRGMPKRLIEKIAPTEISMNVINKQLKRNKGLRNDMTKTFEVPQ